ncbi:MAG: hypothetical protein GTO17_06800 [Candidatus Aminicenantes bacterium]|nr:hypothetical protein [Candidatus Aminicenantes bacterium]
MKKKILALVFIGLLALTGFSFTPTANNVEKVKDPCCCPTRCMMIGVMGCEDIEVNVENAKDGVVVKMTSKNTDMVKKIQEMSAKMKKMCIQKMCCKWETKKEEVKK